MANIVGMNTYLKATLGYQHEVQEQYYETCTECYKAAAEAAATKEDAAKEDEDAWKYKNMDISSCYAEC